jgi:hypothetical protein
MSSIIAGSLIIGGHRVTIVADPISAQDAMTKNYVDSLIGLTRLDMEGKVINLKQPSARSDGATKGYVDLLLCPAESGATLLVVLPGIPRFHSIMCNTYVEFFIHLQLFVIAIQSVWFLFYQHSLIC